MIRTIDSRRHAFSKPAFGKGRSRSADRGRRSSSTAAALAFLLLLVFCLLQPLRFSAATEKDLGFKVQNAELRKEKTHQVLDADIRFGFGEESLEAIHSGVSLTILVDIELRRGPWWWSRTVAGHRLRYRIHSNGLTGRYGLHSPGLATMRSHSSLDEMLEDLGRLRSVPIIPVEDLPPPDPSSPLRARIRAHIDIEALPAPLRPIAWFSPHWRGLGSEWFEWSPRLRES